MQLIINSFLRRDPATVDLGDFVPTTDKDIDGLLAGLRQSLARLTDPHLQAIAQAFLMDEHFMQRFMRVPAGIRNHHAYIGGLLEHVVTLLKLLDRIADLYPQLNIDLLRTRDFSPRPRQGPRTSLRPGLRLHR